jgi:hypothetical protein
VRGNFQVTGSVDTVSETNLTVDDKTITVAKGSGNGAAADSAGLIVDCGSSADADLKWINSGTLGGVGSQRYWTFTDNLRLAPATGVGRLEIAGAGNGVITMTNTLGSATDVITAGAWTGDAIVDGKIASAATWNTAAANVGQWDGGSTGLTPSTGRASLALGSAATANVGNGTTELVTNAALAAATIDGGGF